jgi:hypothetical protein
MSDAELIKKINASLDVAIAASVNKRAALSRDCYDDCQKGYDACMAKAGSPLEQAVCKADYNKCISNC